MNLKTNVLKCVSAFLIHSFSAFLETRLDLMLMEVRGQGFNTVHVQLSICQWDCEAPQPQWKAVWWQLQLSSLSYKRLLFSPWVLWKDWTTRNLSQFLRKLSSTAHVMMLYFTVIDGIVICIGAYWQFKLYERGITRRLKTPKICSSAQHSIVSRFGRCCVILVNNILCVTEVHCHTV